MIRIAIGAIFFTLPMAFGQAQNSVPTYTNIPDYSSETVSPKVKSQIPAQMPVEQRIPELAGIARDGQGDVVLFNAADAKLFCEQHRMHLASVREVAQVATRSGAEIREITAFQSDKQAAEAGFVKVNVGNTYLEDSFYFSWAKYKQPPTKLMKARFWTSSKMYIHPVAPHHQYFFDGENGYVKEHTEVQKGAAVLCLPGW